MLLAFLATLANNPLAEAAARWHPVFPSGGTSIPYVYNQACSKGMGSCVLLQDSDHAVYSPASAGEIFEVFDPYAGSFYFYPQAMAASDNLYLAADFDWLTNTPVVMASADSLAWDVYTYGVNSSLATMKGVRALARDPYSGTFLWLGYQNNYGVTDIYASADGVNWQYDSTIPDTVYHLAVGDPYGTTRVAFAQPWNSAPVFYRQLAGGAWQAMPAPVQANATTIVKPLASVKWNPKAAGGSGMFVAVGDGPNILYSRDGYSWQQLPAGNLPPLPLNDVAFDDQGTAVAVGDHIVLLATDGYSNWYPVPGITQNFSRIDWDGQRFVASGFDAIASSSDGVTWKSWGSGLSGPALADLTFTPYGAVAVGGAGRILASVDGAFWADRSVSGSNNVAPDFTSLAYSDPYGCFFAAGQEGGAGAIYYNCPPFNGQPNPFAAFSKAWVLPNPAGGTLEPLNGIAVSNVVNDPYAGTVVAVGDNGRIIYHPGGTTYYGSGWQLANSPSTARLRAVTHGIANAATANPTAMFVAVGNGIALSSQDGYSWTPMTGANTYLYDVQWINNTIGFVAIGYSQVFQSKNGTSWTDVTGNIPATLGHWGLNAIGSDGTNVLIGMRWSNSMLATPDLANWTEDPYARPVNAITTNIPNKPFAAGANTPVIYQRFADTTPPNIYFPSGLSQWTFGASNAQGLPASDPSIRQLLGSVYAYDAVDGYLFSTLSHNLNLAVLPIGTTNIVFNASDKSGNQAAPATLSITIVDQTPPVITPPADITIEATSALGTDIGNPLVQSFLAAASAADNVDANLTVLNDAPNVFPLGTTTVTFWAYDSAGNLGQASARVTVTTGTSGTIGKAGCVVGAPAGWFALSLLMLAGLTLLARRRR